MVTLSKGHLRDAGLVGEAGGIREEQYTAIEQISAGESRIRTVDGLFD